MQLERVQLTTSDQVRAPAIRGRPTPERKHKSSGSASGPASSMLSSRPTITKSLKRAQKRAQLLTKTGAAYAGGGEHKNAQALLQHGNGSNKALSKSALRRRKRKARDELARDATQGRQGGVGELKEAVEEMEEELFEEGEEDQMDGAEAGVSVGATKGGRVSSNHRKRVL